MNNLCRFFLLAGLTAIFGAVMADAAMGAPIATSRVADTNKDVAIDVSFTELVASPEKYHDRRIRVVAVIGVGSEECRAYMSRDAFEVRDVTSAVELDVASETFSNRLKGFSSHFATIEGVFKAREEKYPTGPTTIGILTIDAVRPRTRRSD